MNATLIRLILGFVSIHACMAGVRMAAPLKALREGQGAVAVGILLALFALTQVFLALPVGRYTDRHGLRGPAIVAVIAATCGTLLAAAWPIFPVLCVAALMTGGATGVLVIAVQREAGAAAQGPTQLKQVFSWLAIGPAVSNFIGPFATGLMIDHAGFRWAFLALAVLPLACWFWLRGVASAGRQPHAPDDGAAGQRRAIDLLRLPALRRLLIVNWMMSACWDVHTFVVPVLGHERGLSASVIGTLLGVFAVAAAVVRAILPLFAHRVVEWRMLTGALISTGVLYVAYPLTNGPWMMGLCSVLLGLSLGSVQPMAMSLLHQFTPAQRHGEVLALRLMAINASSVAMPLLFGAAGAVVGVSLVFWGTSAMLAAGVPAARGLRHAQLPQA